MPLVVDADGLNAFGGEPDRLTGREGRDIIITPHPGKWRGWSACPPTRCRRAGSKSRGTLPTSHHLYVVLKGHRTLIATPDGKVFINPTGNPGMSTGGTGDVLTGMIAAWLAHLLDAEAACKLAVYLHGMAGDLAEADEGEVSMTAGDLAGQIGDAILELTAAPARSARVAARVAAEGRLHPAIITHSESETAAVGRDWRPSLSAGSVVLLHGDLGRERRRSSAGWPKGSACRPKR